MARSVFGELVSQENKQKGFPLIACVFSKTIYIVCYNLAHVTHWCNFLPDKIRRNQNLICVIKLAYYVN